MKVWGITGYFNPMRAGRRLENYRNFRTRLSVPLVTVELSFDGRFDLAVRDAEILIRLRGRDVMWQKERLLNIALRRLPRECGAVAWLDCDVVFERPDWADAACRALDRFTVVHLFRRVYELARTETLESSRGDGMQGLSIMEVIRSGRDATALLQGNMRSRQVHSGLAWAARSEVLKDGFYDACILGSGNRAIICGQLGRFQEAVRYLRMGERWREHYLRWAKGHYRKVQGSVGLIDGRLLHLWHGSLADRKYSQRHAGLSGFEFDPSRDIKQDSHGVWRWSSARPEMHGYVHDYFTARNEGDSLERSLVS